MKIICRIVGLKNYINCESGVVLLPIIYVTTMSNILVECTHV